jgi:hypothetical protein
MGVEHLALLGIAADDAAHVERGNLVDWPRPPTGTRTVSEIDGGLLHCYPPMATWWQTKNMG